MSVGEDYVYGNENFALYVCVCIALHASEGFAVIIVSICLQNVRQVFQSCDDLLRKKQFCYILARHVSVKFS